MERALDEAMFEIGFSGGQAVVSGVGRVLNLGLHGLLEIKNTHRP